MTPSPLMNTYRLSLNILHYMKYVFLSAINIFRLLHMVPVVYNAQVINKKSIFATIKNMYTEKSIEALSAGRLQEICTKGSNEFRILAEQELLVREEVFLEERLYNARHHRLDLSRIELVA